MWLADKRWKQDYLVEPVQEFRPEMTAHHFHHLRLDIGRILILAE
jgi:hypothetical protein